ncbi:MAG: RluA family pseudouridine synthase [Bacillota bacterium]
MQQKPGDARIKKVINDQMDGWTVERVLRQGLGVSRSLLRSAKRKGNILLNGNPVKSNVFVKRGEVLELLMEPRQTSILPQPMALEFLYEDQDLLAVHKPPGMLVHPLTTETMGTLANGVLYHWLGQGLTDCFRPVHRLDRDTSGLVLVAKNPFAHQQLQRQMRQGLFTRRYLALVEGQCQPPRGVIRAPIGPAAGSIIKRAVTSAGQPALSRYTVLRQSAGASLACVQLETGRTHQVRVHMAHLGHPLLGDTLYGGDDSEITRQALHCAYLAFRHPDSGEPVKLACPLPKDMREVIKRLL